MSRTREVRNASSISFFPVPHAVSGGQGPWAWPRRLSARNLSRGAFCRSPPLFDVLAEEDWTARGAHTVFLGGGDTLPCIVRGSSFQAMDTRSLNTLPLRSANGRKLSPIRSSGWAYGQSGNRARHGTKKSKKKRSLFLQDRELLALDGGERVAPPRAGRLPVDEGHGVTLVPGATEVLGELPFQIPPHLCKCLLCGSHRSPKVM